MTYFSRNDLSVRASSTLYKFYPWSGVNVLLRYQENKTIALHSFVDRYQGSKCTALHDNQVDHMFLPKLCNIT
jgi:hypothetical protein